MIKIRMALGGRKKKPVFTIVAADTRSPRDGRFIAKLGQYNPHSTEPFNSVKTEEIKDWLSRGAQLSDSLKSLFRKYNITY
ncbi:MAG: 30S ribosomal protein S16 [Halobacteriovoraceae bacterium]|nr:30S ribosomal protein S16 [Halobacteriovoraceae bacterium]MCB9093753.1 30S ribosomal protein S16 [Halobacteriovoraceae bacterium]